MSRTVTEALLDKIDQQDKEIERLRADIPEAIEAAVERVETFNRANWAALQEAQRQIERLEAKLTQDPKDARCQLYKATQRWQQEAERCNAVVDAARDFVNNHMDHDDAMRIFDALAALEDDDE
jgi:predicted  nucleic acid-binding Zn-ribbon protein